jgi:hypothetical protein
MCPACIANITLMTVGATSGGGVAAFVFSKFYRSSKQIKTKDNRNENQKNRKEKGPGETSQNPCRRKSGRLRALTAREEKEYEFDGPRQGDIERMKIINQYTNNLWRK